MENENFKIGAGYALICLLWGSTWLVIRIGLDSMTPMISAGTRFLLASILIYGVMKFKGIKLQRDKLSHKLYLLMGLFSFAVPFYLVYWAEQFIPSGLTSVLFAGYPFFVLIIARLFYDKEEIGPYKFIGIILGFIGIFIIFYEDISLDLSNDFWGMVAIVVSSIIQAGIAVTIKKHGKHLNSLSMNFMPLVYAGVLLIPAGFLFEDYASNVFDTKALLSLGYLALFGTLFTFTTFYWLMKKISVVILSLSAFITPIIAVILGWIILDERLSLNTLMGSSLVLIGILFANFRGLKNYYKNRKVA